jgi:hypothetical protein
MNLQNKQDTANANVGLRNDQATQNKALLQQDFDNKLKKASGQSGVGMQNANAQGANSNARANANNQLIGGLLGVGSSFARGGF